MNILFMISKEMNTNEKKSLILLFNFVLQNLKCNICSVALSVKYDTLGALENNMLPLKGKWSLCMNIVSAILVAFGYIRLK